MDGLDDHCDLNTDEPDDPSHPDGRHDHQMNALDDRSMDEMGDLGGHRDGLSHHGLDGRKNLKTAQGVNYRQSESLNLGAMIVNGHHLVLHVSLIRVIRNQNY